ncbi:putative esterase [Kipferlia bialata]|uniref:Esterase n=1 Tax=Kipferlia bialata TaxID=797122 RepID=A0A9K3GHA0_9EUKA|nr:putative esterase [Kipferlia bialata]|eukprot:g3452.t1
MPLPPWHTPTLLLGGVSPLGWKTPMPMTKTDKDTWTVTVSGTTPTPKGLEVKITTRATEGHSTRTEACTGHNMLVEEGVDTATVTPYWRQDGIEGEWFYSSTPIHSPELGNDRHYNVYLPPLLLANPYAVARHLIVMHDGQDLFTPDNTAAHTCPTDTCVLNGSWDMSSLLDELISEAAVVQDLVLVGLFATDDRTNEYTYSKDVVTGEGGMGDRYLSFIADTVLTSLDTMVGEGLVDVKPEDIMLIGSDLGGLISCYAGVAKGPWNQDGDTWGGVGAMSSIFTWNNEDMYNVVIPSSTLDTDMKIYLSAGTIDDEAYETYKVMSGLRGIGYEERDEDLAFVIGEEEGHDVEDWASRVEDPIYFMFH